MAAITPARRLQTTRRMKTLATPRSAEGRRRLQVPRRRRAMRPVAITSLAFGGNMNQA
jgi:hypothetical protein